MLEKLSKLRDFFAGNRADAQDVAAIDGWIIEAKKLFLIQSLKGHDGIRYVLEVFESEVSKINEKLISADSKELPDQQRDRLIDRRDLAQKYLNVFLGVEEGLEKIEEEVDAELDGLK